MTIALLIMLCAALLYVIASSVVEQIRYELNLRRWIQFERVYNRVVENR